MSAAARAVSATPARRGVSAAASVRRTSDGCSGRPRTLRNSRSARPRSQRGTAPGQVAVERLLGGAAQRHHPLLVALAGDTHLATAAVDVAYAQRAGLGRPQPAAVQQLQQRAVAQPAGLVTDGSVEQLIELATA